MLMNISCESNLNHMDIVFYENAAGQEVGEEFQRPVVSCNILTKTWFWRLEDSKSKLKSPEWVIKKIKEMNRHNVTFILNGATNQMGRLDENVFQRFTQVGLLYKKVQDVIELLVNWLYR